jgi:hypothetical protein
VNKDLYNKRIKFPDEMKEYMTSSLSAIPDADQYDEGFKRNQSLQSQNSITYQQLKRIKNFFDNFKGDPKDPSYILNGGEKMKGWTEGALRFLRDSIYNTKHNKSETGMENQHIQNHEKDYTNVRPSQKHKSTLQKYDSAVTESLKRINYLMNR